jgi:hypothetical protein
LDDSLSNKNDIFRVKISDIKEQKIDERKYDNIYINGESSINYED